MPDETVIKMVAVDRKLMYAGAALVAAGGVLAATGIACGTYALVSAARAWSQGLPTPPAEMARRRLVLARAAGGAAAQAWRDGVVSG